MRLLRWLIVALLCVAAPASAFWQSRDSNYNVSITSAVTYQGPGDIVGSAKLYVGFAAYNASYIGSKAFNVCDVSTGLVCSDLSISATGYVTASQFTALTQCATSCNFATAYDQSGNGIDLTQATNSKRPVYSATACPGSTPGMVFTASSSMVLSNASFTLAIPHTMIGIAKRTANFTTLEDFIGGYAGSGNPFAPRMGFLNSASTLRYNSGNSNTLSLTSQADSSPHAFQGIANSVTGGTEYFYADGSNTSTSSGVGNTPFGGIITLGASPPNNTVGQYLDGVVCIAGIWGSDFVVGSHTTAMNTEMHALFGSW